MPAATRKKPASRTTGRALARKAPARKPGPRKSAAKGRTRAAPQAPAVWRRVLGSHAADLVGIACLAAAVIAAMGVWAAGAGPVGRAFDLVLRTLAGRAAVVAPFALAAGGVVLLAGRERERALRPVIGAAMIATSVVGLLHAGGGAPRLAGSRAALAAHGGYVGALVGGPLAAGLGEWGAAVVLAALAFAGAVVASGRPPRALLSAVTARKDVPTEAAGAPTAALVAPQAAPPAATAAPDGDAEPAERRKRTLGEVAPPQATTAEGARPEQLQMRVPAPPDAELYRLPPLDLLRKSPRREVDRASLEERGQIIEETLREFKVDAELAGITAGPTVTRYEVELAQGVKVAQFTKLAPDICYALATPDVRILAPIPGRSAIGLEVPNAVRQLVTLGDVLASPEAKSATHPLEVALGRDIAGRTMLVDLTEMPHLLIAGATGAGKSSCINSILTSILCRTRPSEVRMILVDPKRVELGRYGRVPHLLTGVVTQPKRAADALLWAVREMERRYDILADVGARDVISYNASHDRGELGDAAERLPYILVVVDELSDLMLVAARDVEDSICRLAQMARAVGIHLVIATQRPSVDVITGLIKANIPSRMAFKMRTQTDSRTILDQVGADKLVGKGDMLYLPATSSRTQRIQGSYVTEAEVAAVVEHWRKEMRRIGDSPSPEQSAGEEPSAEDPSDVVFGGDDVASRDSDDDGDDLLEEATVIVVTSRLGSTSMLQRKLRVGFARAGRIMDLLERRGVVGPSQGSKARDVLITPEQLEEARLRVR